MSDNLKVAKECGATELGDQSYYTGLEWKDCPRLVFSGDVLEAYTSRVLASQQAAHEAEIARLKEEYDECRADHQKITLDLLDKLRAANAACAMLTKEIEQLKSK